ncbi:hypothetical protein PVAP13_7NG295600 [Panicum virgatum]|uniref:Uncharacterized protein n=1 Tax=Panicum virgatum TaxID=38727 RepID=A0A8T0PVX8_PANVG|nr:hypothetical protein PVAP13_7NG295600 [Panicum virgatum]
MKSLGYVVTLNIEESLPLIACFSSGLLSPEWNSCSLHQILHCVD